MKGIFTEIDSELHHLTSIKALRVKEFCLKIQHEDPGCVLSILISKNAKNNYETFAPVYAPQTYCSV